MPNLVLKWTDASDPVFVQDSRHHSIGSGLLIVKPLLSLQRCPPCLGYLVQCDPAVIHCFIRSQHADRIFRAWTFTLKAVLRMKGPSAHIPCVWIKAGGSWFCVLDSELWQTMDYEAGFYLSTPKPKSVTLHIAPWSPSQFLPLLLSSCFLTFIHF